MPNEAVARVVRSFIDTNLLVYADDAFDARKQKIAIDVLVGLRQSREGVLSIQVLQEYFVNAIKKLGLDAGFARQRVAQYGRFEVVRPDLDLVLAAIDLHRLNQLSLWDALVVQSARSSGSAVLLTEDMQHGLIVAGVRIINPFLDVDSG